MRHFGRFSKTKQGKQVAKGDFRLSDETLSDFGVYDNEFEDKENKKSIDGWDDVESVNNVFLCQNCS